MGFEYRLHIDPPLNNLAEVCSRVFEATEWRQIPTSFLEIPGIGVQLGENPVDPSWPQVADLHHEEGGSVFVICHTNNGGLFMNALVENLQKAGHKVRIDDDI